MRILGVDLASQPKDTGLCLLEAAGGAWRVARLETGADDAALREALLGCDAAGLDVPLGWPEAFLALLAGGSGAGRTWTPEGRDALVLRATDRAVKAIFRRPLSVAADTIALPALRWRLLADALAAEGHGPRLWPWEAGKGLKVAETYPALSLHRWGLPSSGYKGPGREAARAGILAGLLAKWPLTMTAAQRDLACATDHALDALVAALTARAAVEGRVESLPQAQRELAWREGWILVPEA